MTEAQLQELKHGEASAWESFIEEHQNRILNFLFHLEGSYHDALDLTQETFFRAWKGLGTFRVSEPILPWLYTIARNVQCEKHRRKYHAQFSIDEAQEFGYEPSVPDEQTSPQRRAEQQQTQTEVQLALSTLPEEYRSAVVLRFMQELSYEEIAEVQNVAVGTAKSRVFRGKEMLAKALDETMVAE